MIFIASNRIIFASFKMSFKSYLIQLFDKQYSEMNSDFFLVVIPVIILTVMMFSLRAILLDVNGSKFKKQMN